MSARHQQAIAIAEELTDTMSDLCALSSWPAGWNGYDAASPKEASINYAKEWIAALYAEARSVGEWVTPHVTADAHGDVVFEWWKGSRKLTAYVSPDAAEFVKMWGPDIDSQMEDGVVASEADRRSLWNWLME